MSLTWTKRLLIFGGYIYQYTPHRYAPEEEGKGGGKEEEERGGRREGEGREGM